jgi:hypothetical protein
LVQLPAGIAAILLSLLIASPQADDDPAATLSARANGVIRAST